MRSPEATAAQVILERPPPGLARGYQSVPAWVVLVLGSVLVVTSVVALVQKRLHQKRLLQKRLLQKRAPQKRLSWRR